MMATSEGEIARGKVAFAYLLRKEIGEQMPGVVGDFLSEMVQNRIVGAGAADVTVQPAPQPEEPLAVAATEAPRIGRQARIAPAKRSMSQATKDKIAATRARNKAARS